MLPQKSYLVRAFYQWIVDSHCTPYLLVNADAPGTAVPREYVEDGEIVLNISSPAVVGLSIESGEIQFEARFSGIPFFVCVPMRSVLAIYANENGRGMVFSVDEDEQDPPPAGNKIESGDKKASGAAQKSIERSHLRVVK